MDPRKNKPAVKGKRSATKKITPSLGLDEAFDIFYSAKKAEGMRESTCDGYIADWRFFREWLGTEYNDVELSAITPAIIRDYVNHMTTKPKYEGDDKREDSGGLSPFTVLHRFRAIRTIFNFFSREGMIAVNPVANMKPPRLDAEEKDTFTDAQLRALLAAPDIETFAGLRDRTLMLLLADSGLRINEALRLTTEHIDIKSRCIHLPAWMNKNRKPRVVPISPEVVRDLLTLINDNKTYFDADHVFLANYGEPLKAEHFRKRLKIHAKAAGISGQVQVSPHQFRHYFCKTYLLNGGDIFSLQRIVAHAEISTTRKYVQMDDENIRNQHARFSPLSKLGMSRVSKRRG